uniref:YdbS-like PH domain-containing protein n=1 Tax=Pyramimonas obovata TaxID=1411642 RepID=A0A7S0RI51_9CHLO
MASAMISMNAIARVNVPAQRTPAGQMSLRATRALAPRSFSASVRSTAVHRAQRLVVKAADETEVKEVAEDDFEAKLAALKGSRRAGGGAKAAKRVAAQTGKDVALEEAYAPKDTDFSKETVIYEGKPAVGDLITNIALGATLLWLPLTFAAVGRFQWLKYKFTDMRIVMESSAPFESGITQITYGQISKVVTIGRGVGLWGDMVVTLKNGENVEFRSLEKYKELETMINEKIGAIEATQNADPKGF